MKEFFHHLEKFLLCLFFFLLCFFLAYGDAVAQISPEESWLGSFGETWGQNVSELQESIEKILHRNQEIDGDNQRLSQEIRLWQENIQELTLAINSLEPQKKRLENILREKNSRLDLLKQKHSVLNQQQKKIDEKTQSLVYQADFEKKQDQLLQKEIQRLVDERTVLREQKIYQQQSEGQSLNVQKNQKTRLRGLLEHARQRRIDLDQRLVYLGKEAFEASEKLHLMQEKIESLRADLVSTEKNIALADLKRKDLESQKHDLKELKNKENQSLEQDIVWAQSQKGLLEKNLEQLTQELESVSQTDSGINRQGLGSQLEEVRQENRSLKDQLSHLENILSQASEEKESIKRSLLER